MKIKINQLFLRYQEFLRYFFGGMIATALNIGLYKTLLAILPLHYLIINFIVWLITVLFGYYTNRRFVFKRPINSLMDTAKEAGNFIGFRIISGCADSLTMWVLFSLIGVPEIVTKLLANLVASLINYYTSKLIVFKHSYSSTIEIPSNLKEISENLTRL